MISHDWIQNIADRKNSVGSEENSIFFPKAKLEIFSLTSKIWQIHLLVLPKIGKNKKRLQYLLINYTLHKQLYNTTRSPWTAMLAPIKVDEIAQNWKTFLHAKNIQNWCKFLGIGTLCLYRCQNGSKKPLFFSHSTARWNHGSKWNPVMMKHNDPLYQPRYHLSGLIQRIWSYLATTKTCPTGYFLLAPIY